LPARRRLRGAPADRHHDLQLAWLARELRAAQAGRRLPLKSDSLKGFDVCCLKALGAALHFELDFLPFLQRLESGHLDRGVMREQVFAALGRGDEAEAFGVIEPLYGTGCHVHLLPLLNAATIPGATKPGMTIKEVN
jgi:hypothetical protein